MAIPVLPLNEMSVEEKLETMEAIWETSPRTPTRSNRRRGMKRSFVSARLRSTPARQNSSTGKKRKKKSGNIPPPQVERDLALRRAC